MNIIHISDFLECCKSRPYEEILVWICILKKNECLRLLASLCLLKNKKSKNKWEEKKEREGNNKYCGGGGEKSMEWKTKKP